MLFELRAKLLSVEVRDPLAFPLFRFAGGRAWRHAFPSWAASRENLPGSSGQAVATGQRPRLH